VDINQGAGEDWIIVFCLGLACISCAPATSARCHRAALVQEFS
jgi:hypothetical protein